MTAGRSLVCWGCNGRGCTLCSGPFRRLSPATLRRIVLELCVAFWLLVLLACCSPAEAAQRCQWTDLQTGERWAVTVNTIAPGTGGIPWAWFTIDADPRRVFYRPAAELRGCAS